MHGDVHPDPASASGRDADFDPNWDSDRDSDWHSDRDPDWDCVTDAHPDPCGFAELTVAHPDPHRYPESVSDREFLRHRERLGHPEFQRRPDGRRYRDGLPIDAADQRPGQRAVPDDLPGRDRRADVRANQHLSLIHI